MSGEKTIVQFPGKGNLPECPVEVERRDGFCSHEKIRLVEQDRNVVCAACGATLDPFNYLVSGAYAVRRAWEHHSMVMMKVKELEQRLGVLEKERRRLASAVKRLKDKAGGEIDLRSPL